jgi:hypothetical protein
VHGLVARIGHAHAAPAAIEHGTAPATTWAGEPQPLAVEGLGRAQQADDLGDVGLVLATAIPDPIGERDRILADREPYRAGLPSGPATNSASPSSQA